MHDYPNTARFLTTPEKEEVLRRLEHDRSSLADEFDMRYFWDALKDWKIWVHMVSDALLPKGSKVSRADD